MIDVSHWKRWPRVAGQTRRELLLLEGWLLNIPVYLMLEYLMDGSAQTALSGATQRET